MDGVITRSAPCISFPLVSTETIQFNIHDESGISKLQIISNWIGSPLSLTTDCRYFVPPSGWAGTLLEGTDYTTAPGTSDEVIVTIPVATLIRLFAGLPATAVINFAFIITDAACHPNVLQTSFSIKAGCE